MKVDDLRPLAEKLNKVTNELNLELERIEELLKKFGLGVEVDIQIPNGSFFGYHRFVDGWHLSYAKTADAELIPIRSAPRIARVAIVYHLQAIFYAISLKTKELVEEIEQKLPEARAVIQWAESQVPDDQNAK